MPTFIVSWDSNSRGILKDINSMIRKVEKMTYRRIAKETMAKINPAFAYFMNSTRATRFMRHYVQAGPWAEMLREG